MERRQFVKLLVMSATALGATSWMNCGKREGQTKMAESGGTGEWPLGLQSYTLRKMDVLEAIQQTGALGLHYIEIFPGHQPPDTEAERLDAARQALKDSKVTLNAYGVVGLGPDEAKNRVFFDFGKKMGIPTLSADPVPDAETMDVVEKLVEEYGIKIAIHNHGPKSRYSTVGDILKVVEGRHENLGACVDTGHFLRSGVDPVEAIRRLGKRVHGVHLKDWAGVEGEWPVFGEGKLDMVGVFKALREIEFDGFLSIEYEAHPDDPVPYLKRCVEATREAMSKA